MVDKRSSHEDFYSRRTVVYFTGALLAVGPGHAFPSSVDMADPASFQIGGSYPRAGFQIRRCHTAVAFQNRSGVVTMIPCRGVDRLFFCFVEKLVRCADKGCRREACSQKRAVKTRRYFIH